MNVVGNTKPGHRKRLHIVCGGNLNIGSTKLNPWKYPLGVKDLMFHF